MAAIVYSAVASNNYRVISEPVPSVDPAGFDTVEMKICFNGTAQQLINKFPFGSKDVLPAGAALPSDSLLYCLGPQPGAERRFGHIWATIAWKGFIEETKRKKRGISWTFTTRETEFPRTYPRANGSTITVYAGSPYSPGAINPKTGSYYRVRIIDYVRGLRMQGVHVGKPDTPPPLPTVPRNINPPAKLPAMNWGSLPDPTYNYPYGWICRDFQVTSDYTFNNTTLYFWTAHFEWVDEQTP